MKEYQWLIYAALSALAAAFVGVFGKIGMKGVDSTLATAVRSVIMTIFLVSLALGMGLAQRVKALAWPALGMIALSGLAGALSWLFYFKAIAVGEVSKVSPIDKLSMPLGIVLAVLVLGERPAGINWAGIGLMAVGAYLAGMPGKA